jgi:3-oxoacyl-(acyl-carrier-protein) synthase
MLTGAGAIVLSDGESADPSSFLRHRKSRKYMGLQDDLAVIATGRALSSASLSRDALGERAGLFLAVGYIPFDEGDIAPVLEASMSSDGQSFDVRRFGSGGFQRAHPLLTFRCLPNMPAYHVSANFDVQGAYYVTYPGPAQLYAALEEACAALDDRRVDVAIVGAVTAQSNFLVRHHFARIEPPVASSRLRDACAAIILETESHARSRGAPICGRLAGLRLEYTPLDLAGLAARRPPSECVDGQVVEDADGLGPAHLVITLAERLAHGSRGALHHILHSRDGIRAESSWLLAAPTREAMR